MPHRSRSWSRDESGLGNTFRRPCDCRDFVHVGDDEVKIRVLLLDGLQPDQALLGMVEEGLALEDLLFGRLLIAPLGRQFRQALEACRVEVDALVDTLAGTPGGGAQRLNCSWPPKTCVPSSSSKEF